ncbi:hypothetical protein M885DRAFT_625810 [Pelagophyceae sp. CCMP2097]|nr:hypothetical protein M885DRAFT_625810 [Pelagophyceae sp. CCMP2097]
MKRPLPPGWSRHVSDGRAYFAHFGLGTTQWHEPAFEAEDYEEGEVLWQDRAALQGDDGRGGGDAAVAAVTADVVTDVDAAAADSADADAPRSSGRAVEDAAAQSVDERPIPNDAPFANDGSFLAHAARLVAAQPTPQGEALSVDHERPPADHERPTDLLDGDASRAAPLAAHAAKKARTGPKRFVRPAAAGGSRRPPASDARPEATGPAQT